MAYRGLICAIFYAKDRGCLAEFYSSAQTSSRRRLKKGWPACGRDVLFADEFLFISQGDAKWRYRLPCTAILAQHWREADRQAIEWNPTTLPSGSDTSAIFP